MKVRTGGGRNLEGRSVERLIFRNYRIANIKKTIILLSNLFFSFFRNYLNTQNIQYFSKL